MYHCEFKKCKCTIFVYRNKLCKNCNHHKLWHSKKDKPKDGELQFMSPRKNAETPKYVSDVIFGQVYIYKPLPLAPAVEVANPYFCPNVYDLPV